MLRDLFIPVPRPVPGMLNAFLSLSLIAAGCFFAEIAGGEEVVPEKAVSGANTAAPEKVKSEEIPAGKKITDSGEMPQKKEQSDYLKENLYKNSKKTLSDDKPRRDRPDKAPGIFVIRKSGEDYDIDVQMDMFDMKDKNVYFQMDLSKDAQKELSAQDTAKDAAEPKNDNDGEQKSENESAINLSNKHTLYAQTYLAEGKTERALFEVDQSLKAAPNSALALALKGSIYYRMSELDLARTYWKKAYKIDPTIDNLKESLDKIGGN